MDKPRNFHKDTFHHLYNRGAYQHEIFIDKNDCEYFLRKLLQYKEKWEVRILCYCLMPNHYHLFVQQTKEDKTISQFISELSNAFTKGMNKKYKRKGVLFESKVKSKWIEDEAYFKWVVKYILENPVKAGIVQNVIDYEFSSARELFAITSKAITDIEFLSRYFHSQNELRKFIFEKENVSGYEL
jgi:REP element-mobilizing transposase RayT